MIKSIIKDTVRSVGKSTVKSMGMSWQTYWATLISATVENAAPTNVVLTFPTAKPSLGASDFTIAGFTISSASWTGEVLTLVLSYPVTSYWGNLTVTFGKTGATATVTNNVADDGNTVAWYKLGDGSATYMTKDGSNRVSQWNDLSGNDNHLLQATEASMPVYSANGLSFDGSNDYLKTNAFTFNQPEFIYIVYNAYTETKNSKALFDGNADTGALLYYIGHPALPRINAGAENLIYTSEMNVTGEFVVLRALINGATSRMTVNNFPPVTNKNSGTNNMGGITLARWGSTNNYFGKVIIKEAIFRKSADSSEVETSIYNYLKKEHLIVESEMFDNGKLILNFDDGGVSQYVAYEDLIAQGEKATFYIIGSYPGNTGQLSWEQLQTMHANGMDIQCHTYDHPHLTTLTEAQVKAEYDDLDTQFTTNSLPAAQHTSYPYGETNANVVTWTATRRLTGRGVMEGYIVPTSDKYNLKTYGVALGSDYDDIKSKMLIAQNNHWAMMIYSHGIDGSQMPRAKFNEIIDYAQEIGMDIITVSELYALMT